MPVFDPKSPQALSISTLFVVVLAIGLAIIALVAVLVIYCIIKFRHRPGDDTEPQQVKGNRKWEIGWIATPAVLLAGLFVPTLIVMINADPSVARGSQPPQIKPDVTVIGHQFWWEYRYPKYGVVSANELHIPVGKQLLFQIESADVIHDFWVPQLGRKMDAIPGKPNQLYLQSDVTGLFMGACSEYCGAEHAWMLIRVYVQSQADFDKWISQQQQAKAAPTAPSALRGAQLFQQLPCSTCHAIAGTAANGQVGPNLTHLNTRDTLGTGILENNPANLARWILDAPSIKPGVKMPNYQQLSAQQIKDLVAYLEEMNQ
ncbi:MAG TPA: cytochrome c oxidase subunit II [Chloroflexia bacterium]|nr:cytochrome c oxidase subunit II [Chloroflexia bacterium]